MKNRERKTETLNLRTTKSIRKCIEQLADKHSMSKADVVHQILEQALGGVSTKQTNN